MDSIFERIMGRPLYYDQDGNPTDLEGWVFASRDRNLAYYNDDGVIVSTVFIGIDTQLMGPPLIFETAIFTKHDTMVKRYATKEQALEGHETLMGLIKEIDECTPTEK